MGQFQSCVTTNTIECIHEPVALQLACGSVCVCIKDVLVADLDWHRVQRVGPCLQEWLIKECLTTQPSCREYITEADGAAVDILPTEPADA